MLQAFVFLGPVLYYIYTSDLPTTDCTITGTFADKTTIEVPLTTCVKYLGFHLDGKLPWQEHIK